MDDRWNNPLPPQQRSDAEIIKEILSEKESDSALKDKMYRIIHEASFADEENMDTDLINECIETISLIDGDKEQISDEKIKAMRHNIDAQYNKWQQGELKGRFSVKKAAFIAATFIFVFTVSFSIANAFRYNIIQMLVHWGGETFNLSISSQPKYQDDNESKTEIINNNEVFESPEEAIKGIHPVPMLPVWVPEGFTFKYAEKVVRASNTIIILYYTDSENGTVIFDMTVYNANNQVNSNSSFEKDESELQIYEKNDIKHYIFQNINQIQAVWSNSNIVYNISGDVSVEEMKKIINSMYGG